MTFRTTVQSQGTINLGPSAWAAGFEPGAVVEVIVTRAGSLIVAIDTSPPPMDVSFKPLTGGRAQLAARMGGGNP